MAYLEDTSTRVGPQDCLSGLCLRDRVRECLSGEYELIKAEEHQTKRREEEVDRMAALELVGDNPIS